jgi:DNA-binding XRE family transcriptional regulator
MEPNHVRFKLILERLRKAPAAQTFDEAFQQIADILVEVENEHTDITMSLNTLREKLAKRFPTAVIELDEASNASGSSFLDARLTSHLVTVEWRKKRGCGVTSRPDVGYGEGVDETYTNEGDAFRRTVSLLLSQTKTTPPPEVRLRELREAVGMSQTELAKRMSIQQASVSKIEQGRDLRMSTLSSLIAALGGGLSVAARFPDGSEQRLDVCALMGKK